VIGVELTIAESPRLLTTDTRTRRLNSFKVCQVAGEAIRSTLSRIFAGRRLNSLRRASSRWHRGGTTLRSIPTTCFMVSSVLRRPEFAPIEHGNIFESHLAIPLPRTATVLEDHSLQCDGPVHRRMAAAPST